MPRRITHSYWTLQGTLSQETKKRLRFSTPSLLLSFIIQPGILRVLSPLSWCTQMRSRITPPPSPPQQFRRKQRPASPPAPSQIYRPRWDWPKCTDRAGRNDCCATFYQQSWSMGEVPDNWKLANKTTTYKNCQKEDLRNYNSVSLHSESHGLPGMLLVEWKTVWMAGHTE